MAREERRTPDIRQGLTGRGIVKRYGKKEVLHGIDLALEPGKIYGLIGRNGAGKTTLLSLLSAQNPLTAGEVLLDGEPVWENISAMSCICFSRELNPSGEAGTAGMKVGQYLDIAAAYFPHWDREMESRLLAHFQLERREKLAKLSKGMLSMVTIITAMASKAPYTFLDEPAAGLDVIAREEFYRMLLEEYAATGRTFVISTHIIDEAAAVLEETIILKDGEILVKKNTEELVASCVYISGREEEVRKAAQGLRVYHWEAVGRSVGCMVWLREGEELPSDCAIQVQPVSLQKIFAALCQEGGEAQ